MTKRKIIKTYNNNKKKNKIKKKKYNKCEKMQKE